MPDAQRLQAALSTLSEFEAGSNIAFNTVAQQAARTIYEHFCPRFIRFYCRKGQPECTAQEIANEAMLKLIRNVSTLNAFQALEKWAWIIARNTLNDHFRQQRLVQEHETGVDEDVWRVLMETIPLDSAGDPIVSKCFEQQFALFVDEHPKHAECIEHMALNSADTNELAKFLGRTTTATREFLFQSRKKLREFIHRCLE